MQLAFQTIPIFFHANPFDIPYSMILKKVQTQKPLAVIQPAQGTFRPDAFHQAVRFFRIDGLIFCGHRVRKFHQRPLGFVTKLETPCTVP